MEEKGECRYCGKFGIDGDVCNECSTEDKKEKERKYIG